MINTLRQEIEFLEEIIEELDMNIRACNNDELMANWRRQIRFLQSIHTRLKLMMATPGDKGMKFEAFQDFVGAYNRFYREKVDVPPRFGPAMGKAMKEIIEYLVSASKDKSEAGALDAWKFILVNWDRLSPFLQQQKGLLQINKNLSEILDQLRNGHSKSNNSKDSLKNLEKELKG